MKKVVTHNGIFHADEVVAVALLKSFYTDETFEVTRVNHQTPAEELGSFDYIIDIGSHYNEVKWFDHHHLDPKTVPMASAGLVWKYVIGEADYIYPSICELVIQVDLNDIGIEKAEPHSFVSMIKYLNTDNPYSQEQEEAFAYAVNLTVKYITAFKSEQDKINKASETVKSTVCVTYNNRVTVRWSDDFIPMWDQVLTDATGADCNFFAWYDKVQDKYKIQAVPVEPGSFEFGIGIDPALKEQIPGVEFIHNGKFFAVAKDKKSLEMLIKAIKF